MNIEDRLADKLASESKEAIMARRITEAELKEHTTKAGQFGGGGQLAPEPEDAPKACSGPLMPQATDDKEISDMAEKLTQEEVKKMANCPGEERGDMKQMEATDDQDLQDIYQEKLVDDKAEVSRGMLSKTVDVKRPKYKDIKEGDVIELVNNNVYTVTDWYNGHVSAKGPDGKDYALYKSTYDFAVKKFTRDNKVLWEMPRQESRQGMVAAQGDLIITAAKLIKFAKTAGQGEQNDRLVKVAGEMSEVARALESNMNRKAAEELEASQPVFASTSFYEAYVIAALWSSTDDDDDPLDSNYDARDLAPETVRKMKEDCEKFQKENKEDLEIAKKQGHDEAHCGHDFWLTRNGHGAGFWDRDYITPDQKREYNQLSAEKHDIEEQIEELKKEDMSTAEELRKEAELSLDLQNIKEEMEEIDNNQDVGERLTKACKKFKEQNLYVGDDGKLYVE